MPNYDIPTQIQTPNFMGNLNNVVGVAQGLQGLQTQRLQQQQLGQTIESGGIALQAQRQANQERQNFISAFGKDPDLTPGPNGLIEPNAAFAKLQQIAPQTATDWFDKIMASNSANVKMNDDLRSLGANNLKDLGQVLQPTLGQGIATKAKAAQDWADTVDTPSARRLVNQFVSSLGKSKSKQDGGDDGDAITLGAVKRGNAMLSQLEAVTPGVSLVGTGGKVQPVVTAPKLSGMPLMSKAGEDLPVTLGPGEVERIEQDPVSQQAVIVRRAPNGTIVSARPAAGLPQSGGGGGGGGKTSGGNNVPAPGGFTQVPAGETVGTLSQFQQTRAASNAAAKQTGEVASNNKQILDLLKNGQTATGSNAPFVKDWMGSIGLQWTNDESTNLDRISHFLALQQQANEKAMGVSTDAGREVSGLASGGIKMTGPALQSAIKANDALNTGVGVFNTGLEKTIANKGIGGTRAFQNQWSKAFDPVVYRYANAIRDGDTEEKARIEKQYGKGTPAWGTFVQKMQALHNLEVNGAQ